MDSRDRLYRTREVNGTICEDFDLYAKSGQARLPAILHDGTGQAWVSSLQSVTNDHALSTRYDFGRAAVFDEFGAGWQSVRGGELPHPRTLTRWLKRSEGGAIHRFGSFLITHPNSAYNLGKLAAQNYSQTQF